MKNHMTRLICVIVMLAALMALNCNPEQTLAQTPDPEDSSNSSVIAPGALPVQGKLTDASGVPLNGTFTMVLSLYETVDAVDDLCYDVVSVNVVNGLFNTYLDHCYDNLTGQKVWLGIKVGSDEEMTPRQPIYSVPYAISLVPGAQIITDHALNLTLTNSNTGGKALSIDTTAATGTNYGVFSTSASSSGTAGYFSNTSGGTALYASSTSGTAITAAGTGKIKSSANSYVWISGNDARPFQQSDTTVIDMDTVGGAKIIRYSGSGNRNIMLPITITGPLYGQDVRITGVDIYWLGNTEFEAIAAVLLRRQTAVSADDSHYVSLINDHPAGGYSCDYNVTPDGCTQHYDITSNNVISSSSGILYLTIELAFGGNTNWIKIGGVRLTLEHD